MKKIFALSLAFAAFTLSVSAQQSATSVPTSTDQKAKKEWKHDGQGKAMRDLNLTDAQKAQMKVIREDKTLSKDARKAKMDNIFTADQKATLAKSRAEHQAKGKEMHEKRAKEMQSKLGLSNDQAAKLKAQNDARHAQMKAIKDDKSLSDDARKSKNESTENAGTRATQIHPYARPTKENGRDEKRWQRTWQAQKNEQTSKIK